MTAAQVAALVVVGALGAASAFAYVILAELHRRLTEAGHEVMRVLAEHPLA